MKGKKETRLIKDLKQNLFVRKELNQDHALYLAELLDGGVELPRIWINQEGMVIDGRHRIEAHELCRKSEIDCEVFDVTDEAEMIVMGYRGNLGGALPPSQGDTERTVMLLLERGEAKKRIGELLGLPASMARKYVKEVESKALRAKLQRAADAVTDGGLTLAKAAEQYEVEEEKLKEMLSGRRRQHKGGITEIKRNLTKLYQSIGLKNAGAFRRLLEQFEDSDVTGKQVRDIFAHAEHLQKESARKVADWRKRFEAMSGTKGAK